MYRIRRTDNIEALRYLKSRILPSDEEDFKNWINWIAWCDDNPIAFSSAKILALEPDTLFLSLAGVLPRHTGKGLHKRLIRCRIRYAKSAGLKKVITYCVSDNIRSAVNLENLGFRLYLPDYKYAGEAWYFMKII